MPPEFSGKTLKGTDQGFLAKVISASEAVGVTKIDVFSAKRTPATNTGVANSNHLSGHAIDAKAFIPGKGWVSLGTALLPVAAKYGLRSGDVDGFYKGAHDPPHVDDGYNVGRAPVTAAGASQPQDSVLPPQSSGAVPTPEPISLPEQPYVPIVQPPVLEGRTTVDAVDYTQHSRKLRDVWREIAALPDSSPDTQRYASILNANV